MDPLTHTLVGANLAATGLGDRSRFASAALIVGANLPDIDGICYFIDGDLALGFRRGWTHGVLALALLPLLQTGLFVLLDRLRPDPRRALDRRWMLLLSAIAIWSHPALDWLNTYGMRWLMPFDGRWFYGDAVFIMDPWLWLLLGTAFLAGRRANATIVIVATIMGGWTLRTVWNRAPEYLPLLASLGVIFLAALLWRRPLRDALLARRISTGALALATIYIAGRLVLNEMTERKVAQWFAERGETVTSMMAGPHPVNPLQWNIIVRTGDVYRYGELDWRLGRLRIRPEQVEAARDTPEWRRAISDPSVRGLVTWLRFPACEIEQTESETLVHIFDARRFSGGRRATVVLR